MWMRMPCSVSMRWRSVSMSRNIAPLVSVTAMLQNCVPVQAIVFRASESACTLRPAAAAAVAAASLKPVGMLTTAMPCSCVVRSWPSPHRLASTATASS